MLFIPSQQGVTEANSVQVSVERIDEIDETTGAQIQYPAEVVEVYDDGTRRRTGIEDFRELAELVLALHDRDVQVAAAS